MRTVLLFVVCLSVVLAGCATQQVAKQGQKLQYVQTATGRWLVHDMNRPAPPVITPGTSSTQDEPGKAPSDAVVLFDGTDLSKWTSGNGGPAKWLVRDGYMQIVKGTGSIKSKQKFGSCQLHVEFATPAKVSGNSQGRGNSGVFLMDTYEVQVLDSYHNRTYADGQCAALYGRAVPLVNACREPGQWQWYDIIFHRPIFKGDKVVRKATFTVFQNGVLVQDHVQLEGGTDWRGPHAVSTYKPHPDKLPISLQDHGNPVRYRNIWIRPLAD
jgi:3-keto-disaccharide hydrolase